MMREAARHAHPTPFEPLVPGDFDAPEDEAIESTEEASFDFDASSADWAALEAVAEGMAITDEAASTFEPVDDAPESESTVQDAAKVGPMPAASVPIYTPPTDEPSNLDSERQAKLEEQRIRRIRRRKEQARRRRVGMIGGFLRTMFIAFFAAALASTIFTWFTSPDFITPRVVTSLQIADATSIAAVAPPTATSIPVTPNFMQRIGIVAGHRGPENDPGAVCSDGLTEGEINFGVAQLVVRDLRTRGYTVELLDEFDARLENFHGAALVSLHSNDCRDYGEYVSGYLVARAAARPPGGLDDVLAECISLHYGRITGIERRFSLTLDMTDYHTFREIHPLTPAAILEKGFMKDDRALLTERQGDIAKGVVDGILCFLNGENPIPELTATPSIGG
jgi:N-acetylmuramoyl-L-alanine amidase